MSSDWWSRAYAMSSGRRVKDVPELHPADFFAFCLASALNSSILALIKMAARTKTPKQGTLTFRSWGGKRTGAGRPRGSGRRNSPHRKRLRLKSYEPQHTTLRLVDQVSQVRRWSVFAEIVSAISNAQRATFRVIEFSVQDGHLHLLTEAESWKKLSDGIRALEIRIARAVNRVLGRTGKVFGDRYHARALGSPREARNALVYVLQNAKKHAQQRGVQVRRDWLDRFSSAGFFAGWDASSVHVAERLRAQLRVRGKPLPDPRAEAKTWLLRQGWKRHGLLRATEVPAS